MCSSGLCGVLIHQSGLAVAIPLSGGSDTVRYLQRLKLHI